MNEPTLICKNLENREVRREEILLLLSNPIFAKVVKIALQDSGLSYAS